MPAGIAVAGYFALTGTAAAVAAAVVNGAIAGALIGAATSAATGGNVFKGALKGAIIGGITGGVLKGASIAMAGEAAAGVEAGVTTADVAMETAPGITTPATGAEAIGGAGAVNQTPTVNTPPAGGVPNAAGVTPKPTDPGFFGGDYTKAGLLQGAGQGIGAWSAARSKSADEEEARNQIAAQRAGSQPVAWKSPAPRINVSKPVNFENVRVEAPSYAKYFLENAGVKKGLLIQGAAA